MEPYEDFQYLLIQVAIFAFFPFVIENINLAIYFSIATAFWNVGRLADLQLYLLDNSVYCIQLIFWHGAYSVRCIQTLKINKCRCLLTPLNFCAMADSAKFYVYETKDGVKGLRVYEV